MNIHKFKQSLFLLILFGCIGIAAQEPASDLGKPPALKQTTVAPAASQKKTQYRMESDSSAKGKYNSRTKKTKSNYPTKNLAPNAKKTDSKAKSSVNKKPGNASDRTTGGDASSSQETSPSSHKNETTESSSAEPEAAVNKKPAMGENDSIPFMQNKDAGVPAESRSGSIWLKTIGSVLLILGLLFIGTWVVKKTGIAGLAAKKTDGSPELRILSSVSPRNGQTISVVRFGDRTLLVGSTPQSFTLLADELSDEIDPEEAANSFEFEGRPVSVAELLAREEPTFEEEFTKADKLLSLGLGGRG